MMLRPEQSQSGLDDGGGLLEGGRGEADGRRRGGGERKDLAE